MLLTRYEDVVKLQVGDGNVCTVPAPYTTTPAREIVMPRKRTTPQPLCAHCGAPCRRPVRSFCGTACWRAWSARPEVIAARFWKKVNKDGPISEARPDLGPCWLWIACRNKDGYGSFGMGRSNGHSLSDRAHRVAFRMAVGEIPEDREIDHLCRVRACVRPSHLELVTSRENTRRGMSVAAMHARQTHCKRGHPFDAENTIRDVRNNRVCRTCARADWRRYNARSRRRQPA